MSLHQEKLGTTRQPAAAEHPGHRVLLCVNEPLDEHGARSLLRRVAPLRPNCGVLVVDLQRSEYLDSAGVRALLTLSEELEADEKELHLVVQPGTPVERTLELLGLRERLHAYSTLEHAWSTGASTH